jgi:predicted RNA-binding protein with PIN domain
MPRPYLLIDGYNLMHAAGMARRNYGPGQLERCRHRFLAYLAGHLTAQERERTTIVFDAFEAPPDLPRQATFGGMAVLFASPGKDADDTIEELVAAHSSPRQIRLVSGDHRLQRSAQKRRGTFVDSDEFFDALERRGEVSIPSTLPPETPRAAPEVPSADPRSDTESWLRIFGDIPESEDVRQTAPHEAIDVKAIQAEIDREDAALHSQRPIRPPKKPAI